jgi:hypothetical protein
VIHALGPMCKRITFYVCMRACTYRLPLDVATNNLGSVCDAKLARYCTPLRHKGLSQYRQQLAVCRVRLLEVHHGCLHLRQLLHEREVSSLCPLRYLVCEPACCTLYVRFCHLGHNTTPTLDCVLCQNLCACCCLEARHPSAAHMLEQQGQTTACRRTEGKDTPS